MKISLWLDIHWVLLFSLRWPISLATQLMPVTSQRYTYYEILNSTYTTVTILSCYNALLENNALKWFAFFNDKTVRLFPGLISRHSIEMWGQYRIWIPSLYIPTHELWSILMSNLSTEILLHEEINEILKCKCRSLKVILTIVHVANIIQY